MGGVLTYFDELCRAMALLAASPRAVFMGQGVASHGGTSMSQTFRDVPEHQRLELPVAEDMQMGMAIGMSLGGVLPICIFPRWNFMICALNQLVNHLDRLPIYSAGGYRPKVIIRVAVPSTKPFNPQSQHDDDFTEPVEMMMRTVKVQTLLVAEAIMPAYRKAMQADHSTIMVEYTERYRNARGER